jgi:hypothetical protein
MTLELLGSFILIVVCAILLLLFSLRHQHNAFGKCYRRIQQGLMNITGVGEGDETMEMIFDKVCLFLAVSGIMLGVMWAFSLKGPEWF